MGRTAKAPDSTSKQPQVSPIAHRLHVALIQEGDAVSAIALNLPGVASFGNDEASAIENVKEAAAGCIASYESAGNGIPWEPSESAPKGAKTLWLVING